MNSEKVCSVCLTRLDEEHTFGHVCGLCGRIVCDPCSVKYDLDKLTASKKPLDPPFLVACADCWKIGPGQVIMELLAKIRQQVEEEEMQLVFEWKERCMKSVAGGNHDTGHYTR